MLGLDVVSCLSRLASFSSVLTGGTSTSENSHLRSETDKLPLDPILLKLPIWSGGGL